MPRPQTVNLATVTPYVKKFVPKRIYKKAIPTTRVVAMRPGGYTANFRQTELLSKDIDAGAAAFAFPANANFSLLNGTAQGDGVDERQGRQINLKSIQIKGTIQPYHGATVPVKENVKARMVVVLDKQANGVAPTWNAVFKSNTSQSLPNLDNRYRFSILYDRTFPISYVQNSAGQITASTPRDWNVNFYKKLNMKTTYKGTDASIASVATNALYLVLVVDDPTISVPECTVARRIRYTD